MTSESKCVFFTSSVKKNAHGLQTAAVIGRVKLKERGELTEWLNRILSGVREKTAPDPEGNVHDPVS